MKKILLPTAVLISLVLATTTLFHWELPHKGDVLLVTFAALITAAIGWATEKDNDK